MTHLEVGAWRHDLIARDAGQLVHEVLAVDLYIVHPSSTVRGQGVREAEVQHSLTDTENGREPRPMPPAPLALSGVSAHQQAPFP